MRIERDAAAATAEGAGTPGPWEDSFEVDGLAGGPIKFQQVTNKSFLLGSSIRYFGPDTGITGLPNDLDNRIRSLRLEDYPEGFETDLASVPGPLRWFMGSYGVHTPAAMIHDMLIPTPAALVGSLTEQQADRYFRFMLHDLGVRWFKRWLMWSAVALRTRYAAKGVLRWTLVAWIVASLVGISLFVGSLITASWGWLVVSLVAPVVLAGLWGRQYGAGIIGAIAAPWFLPPTALAAAGYGVYWLSEQAFGAFVSNKTRGSGSLAPEGL
jgi:hypothetical protein